MSSVYPDFPPRVIPADAGIQTNENLGSGVHRNDGPTTLLIPLQIRQRLLEQPCAVKPLDIRLIEILFESLLQPTYSSTAKHLIGTRLLGLFHGQDARATSSTGYYIHRRSPTGQRRGVTFS